MAGEGPDLTTRARAGDEQAFAQLVGCYRVRFGLPRALPD